MEKSDRDISDEIFTPEKTKAWIITLALGIVICTGLIVYSLITHISALNFLDSSLFKPGLVWLGSVAMILFFETYLFFGVSTSIFEFLPEQKKAEKITAIIGFFLLILSFTLLLCSFNLETEWKRYVGFIGEGIGFSILLFKEVIQQKYHKIAKIWSLTGAIAIFMGMIFN